MKQKHLDYLAPEAEILVVRFEGGILTNSVNGAPIQNITYDDDELYC
jgi:hypothetical protein